MSLEEALSPFSSHSLTEWVSQSSSFRTNGPGWLVSSTDETDEVLRKEAREMVSAKEDTYPSWMDVHDDPLDVLSVLEGGFEDGERSLDGGVDELRGRLGIHVERGGLDEESRMRS